MLYCLRISLAGGRDLEEADRLGRKEVDRDYYCGGFVVERERGGLGRGCREEWRTLRRCR